MGSNGASVEPVDIVSERERHKKAGYLVRQLVRQQETAAISWQQTAREHHQLLCVCMLNLQSAVH